MAERFHLITRPFMHSFTNYVRFLAFFSGSFYFGKEAQGMAKRLQDNLAEISRWGYGPIMSGQEYSADYFTAEKIDSVCIIINDIWYCIDGDSSSFEKIGFDDNYVELYREQLLGYLGEISPKYKGSQLTRDLLGKVSGDFYSDLYQPIKPAFYAYESWLEKEREFKNLAMATVSITLIAMLMLLLLRYYIPMQILTLLCVLCCGLFLWELYKLMGLEDFAKRIMR